MSKIDIGLGKAATINAIGNMMAQSSQNDHEREMMEKADENGKIAIIQAYEFSSDESQFIKQFIGMVEDYKSSFDLDSNVSKAYYARMEKELKVLKVTNPDLYTKANTFFEEASTLLTTSKAKKKRNTLLLVIGYFGSIALIGLCYFIYSQFIK